MPQAWGLAFLAPGGSVAWMWVVFSKRHLTIPRCVNAVLPGVQDMFSQEEWRRHLSGGPPGVQGPCGPCNHFLVCSFLTFR
jgi:hypothetical protein